MTYLDVNRARLTRSAFFSACRMLQAPGMAVRLRYEVDDDWQVIRMWSEL